MRALNHLPRPRVVLVSLALAFVGSGIAPVRANPVDVPVPESNFRPPESLQATLMRQAPSLDSRVLSLALQAHWHAWERRLLPNPRLLTVIDYSLPSTQPRFWVFDLANRRLLFEEQVAHGKNSGGEYATQFSNEMSSLQTSLGLFVTGERYYGEHGESMRLQGLEAGWNDRAMERAIVIHGAEYVSSKAISALGFLGRSWGCPALRPEVTPRVIDTIKDGSAVFAYFPERKWLSTSTFLDWKEHWLVDMPQPMLGMPSVPAPPSMTMLVPVEPVRPHPTRSTLRPTPRS